MHISQKYSSLATHLHITAHALLDVECTSCLHKNCFETGTVAKRFFTHSRKCAGKDDFFDLAATEAPLSDVLNSLRNFYAP